MDRQYWVESVVDFVLNSGARPVATQKRTKNATISPFTFDAEPGPG
jgi:hypothetical protein